MKYLKESDTRKIKKVKQIVNNVFSVDVLLKSRKRKYVNARMVYSKILREQNFTYYHIGLSLLKNHASILHYVKSIDWILSYDKKLLKKYEQCLDLLDEQGEDYLELTKAELILLVKKLKKQNNLLSLSQNV
tara:strand:- start:416 stop:811 length:396 start_codon:yes stop_codon:yes gene_type:complete